MKFFANKIGTTMMYDDQGRHQVVSVLRLFKTVVGRIKTAQKDGYDSLVLVQESEKAKPRKTVAGQFKNLQVKKVMEDRLTEASEAKVGDDFKISDLQVGDEISIVGTSKGKGFQGTVMRHNFNTGPKTHGSRNYRRPGSIGMTTPSRVTKGKKMAGHTGAATMTMKRLKIVRLDEKENMIWVKGHVVGPNKGELVVIK